ncbi:MAG TPA: hypothetical protein V6D29_24670 [Leptolyngbyaceae cyanobacterium]
MNTAKTTTAFRLVFFTTVSFTLLSGGTSLWLASKPELSPQQNRIFENTTTNWQLGIEAIFGLIGSKATDFSEDDNEPAEDKK